MGNFIGIQNSHTVGCEQYDALPYRTGYEEVVGSRVDDLFAVKAEADGEVVNLTKEYLTVLYKGGQKKSYEVGIRHGVVSGLMMSHNRICDLEIGHKFHKLDILIFDSGFFQRAEMNTNNVIYKHGVLGRVAFIDNARTNEDGGVITSDFAKKFYTVQTKAHYIIIDFDEVVHNLVSVDQEVNPETILCTLEGFVSEELQTKDPTAILALSKIGANNPKAKVYGKITAMDIVYFGNVEDMNPSLKTIANKYDSQRSKKVTTLGTDDAKVGKISSSIRVGGIKLEQNQLAIRIFIDSLLGMNSGDKYVVSHQLKGTVSEVVTDQIYSEDGQPLDMEFAMLSASNRIVESFKIMGMMNSILIAGTKEMIRIYKS